ncbi:MAG: S8 family serine peptidase [Chloroflexi bacterium]|nr:S8 family serine peptidase [Chloroflexota bacterium]
MKASSSRIQLAGVALLLAVMVMSVALPAAAQAPRPMRHVQGDAAVRGEAVADVDLSRSVVQADGRVQVIVTLAGTPAVADYIAAGGRGNHAAALGTASIREAQLRADQNVFAAGASSLGATVVNSSAFLVNTVTVAVAPDQVAALQRLPGVVSVHANRIIERADTTSVPLIGAPDVWENDGFDGAGVVVGVADTGIDYIHTHFGGSGDYNDNPDTTNSADSAFFPAAAPAAYGAPKVVGGYDYVGDGYDASTPGMTTPVPDDDPIDCAEALGGGHGSHVAGSAAGYGVVQATGATYTGPMDTSYYGSFPNPTATLRIGPGVAPGASLVALRIFGCNGSVGTDVLLDAIEDAVTGSYPTSVAAAQVPVDVLNMSLGSSYGGALHDDPLAVAQDAATAAGMIIVDSAGNSGNVPLITGAPGAANSVISVSSSLDTSAVGDVVLYHNTGLGSPGQYPGAAAAFNNGLAVPLTGDLVVAQPLDGCTALTNAAEVAGNVVLIQRGVCGFVIKGNNGFAAGASGVIVYNNQGDGLVTMAADGINPLFNLPAYFIGQTNGTTLKDSYDDAIANTTALPSVTFDFGTPTVFATETVDTLSSFSSRGGIVRSTGDLTLKPNVTAPGNTITSARSGTGDGLYVISGTSMASPHVAGFAALLREKFPVAPVSAIKAMIMNTANNDIFAGPASLPPQHVGTGRVDAVDAFDAEVIAYATDNPANVALSFGYPHVLTGTTYSNTKSVTIQNLSANAYTFDLSYVVRSDHPLVDVTVTPSTIAVAGNTTVTFDVEFEAALDGAGTNINTYAPAAGSTRRCRKKRASC